MTKSIVTYSIKIPWEFHYPPVDSSEIHEGVSKGAFLLVHSSGILWTELRIPLNFPIFPWNLVDSSGI